MGDLEPGAGQPLGVSTMHKGELSPEHHHKAEVTTSIRREQCVSLPPHFPKSRISFPLLKTIFFKRIMVSYPC